MFAQLTKVLNMTLIMIHYNFTQTICASLKIENDDMFFGDWYYCTYFKH